MATILNYDFDGISKTCEYYYQNYGQDSIDWETGVHQR